MGASEKLTGMKDHAYRSLGVMYDSNGKVLTKKQMAVFVHKTVRDKLDFAIEFCKEKNTSYIELQELRDLLIFG